MTSNSITATVTSLTYPRTGKRGVPQQFARRLYELLEGEAKLMASNPGRKCSISWSDAGTAFKIFDIVEFSAEVLPRYFRTKKFSSFQRNLNLYGFTKVRRGPDTDMYAHPSFIRGKPENLSLLRKTTTSTRRTTKSDSVTTGVSQTPTTPNAISPTLGPILSSNTVNHEHLLLQSIAPQMFQSVMCSTTNARQVGPSWITLGSPTPPPQTTQQPSTAPVTPIMRLTKSSSKGMLDLLALAVEHNEGYSV